MGPDDSSPAPPEATARSSRLLAADSCDANAFRREPAFDISVLNACRATLADEWPGASGLFKSEEGTAVMIKTYFLIAAGLMPALLLVVANALIL